MEGRGEHPDVDSLDFELLKALDNSSEYEDDDVPLPKRQRARITDRAGISAAPPNLTGEFGDLSADLVHQVLACVSAADLIAIAQTCRVFRQAANEADLWRPLFLARWGEQHIESSKLQDSTSWKEKYMDRDAQDVADVRDRVPGSMQRLYLQMSTAKRTLTLPRRRTLIPLSDIALRGKISRWRGARRLLNCPSPALGAKHLGCSKRGPYAALEGGLFMCESCGWAHLCGEGCTERLIDEGSSEMLVCPISGRCFERMMADWDDDGRELHEGEGAYDFATAGHWGRAYADGYNCASEEELRYRCGVVM